MKKAITLTTILTIILFLLSFTIQTTKSKTKKETIKIKPKEVIQNEIKQTPKKTYKQIDEKKINIKTDDIKLEKYLPILMFHYIENTSPKTNDKLRYNLSFSPEKLEQFLIFFKENNITPLTFLDIKEIIEKEKEFPEKAVILTFDDGYINHYTNAFRILKKHNMKGVFFIISSKPDNDPNYANWKQIIEMSENGQEIASHSISHPDLTKISEEKMKNELKTSKETIEEKIGKPVISFCYPSGKYNEKIIETVKENYLFARTTNPGKHFSLSKKYEIPTVRIFPTTNIESLKIWFSEDIN